MDLVAILFSSAMIIDFAAAGYALYIRSLMKGGALQRVALAAALSAFVFGIHHLGELAFEGTPMIALAEGVEMISGALLIWAIYELYQLVRV